MIVQDDTIEYVNPRVDELTGYPADTLIGESPAMLALEDDREMVIDLYRAHAREDVPSGPHEITVVTRTGEQVPVEVNIGTLEYEGSRDNRCHSGCNRPRRPDPTAPSPRSGAASQYQQRHDGHPGICGDDPR